jgi:hypothetical protein
VAEIVFTDEEMAEVERLCTEFDPASHVLTMDHLQAIEDPDNRELAIEVFRDHVRGELLGGLMLRAVARAAGHLDIADPYSLVSEDVGSYRPHRDFTYGMGTIESLLKLNYVIEWNPESPFPWKGRKYLNDHPAIVALWKLLDIVHDAMFGEERWQDLQGEWRPIRISIG